MNSKNRTRQNWKTMANTLQWPVDSWLLASLFNRPGKPRCKLMLCVSIVWIPLAWPRGWKVWFEIMDREKIIWISRFSIFCRSCSTNFLIDDAQKCWQLCWHLIAVFTLRGPRLFETLWLGHHQGSTDSASWRSLAGSVVVLGLRWFPTLLKAFHVAVWLHWKCLRWACSLCVILFLIAFGFSGQILPRPGMCMTG